LAGAQQSAAEGQRAMLNRVVIVGTGLIALAIMALFTAGLQPIEMLLRPIHQSDGPALLIFLLDAVILIYTASSLFMLWKFVIQPRRSGFLFNGSQDPKFLQRILHGVPKFYNTNSTDFDWLAEIEKHAPLICAEIRGFLDAQDSSARYFHIAYNNKILELSPSWRTLNLVSYGVVNSNILPKTLEILGRVPNLFTCNLSRMAPRSRLKFHAGESTCFIRCHFGVKIPAAAPTTALHVGGEMRSWQEGRVQAFCDAHWHGAVNNSDEARYVLIFDVMQPKLGWYTKQFCALMVAFTVTLYLLPGRLSVDEPLWRPGVLIGYIALSTCAPLLAGFYLYFRFCKTRPAWLRRLADAGFGFFF
jgi:hypothetical protein